MRNLVDSLSEKTIKITYTFFTIVILIISGYNFLNSVYFNALGNDQCVWNDVKGKQFVVISQIVKNGVTEHAGIQEGDTLYAINGKSFKNGVDAMNIINKVKYGDYATYHIKRNDHFFNTNVRIIKAININTIAQFVLGLGFLIVGFVVIMTKPKELIQRKFALYALYSMIFFGITELRYDIATTPMWIINLYRFSYVFARIVAPPLFITFFFYFPVRLNNFSKKSISITIFIINFALVSFFFFFPQKFMNKWANSLVWIHLAFYITGLAIFCHSYFTKIDKDKKNQLRPILIGIIIGVLAFIYTFVISGDRYAIFLQPAILLPTLFIIIVPIAFGYSIFRYKLMDIDLIIRRSLIYGIVTATFAAIYIGFVLGLGTAINKLLGTTDNLTISIFAFIIIAFAFDPLKRRVQDWVDRYYYQERYNYQKALLEFSHELPGKIDLKQIIESTVSRISNTMHIEKVAVTILNGSDCECISKNIDSCLCRFSTSSDGLYNYLKRTKAPQSFGLLSEEYEQISINANDKQKLIDSGIVLAVPMFYKDILAGIVLVGEKLSGKFYSQEDIDLLLTVANQAAIAVENARLYESEIEKQKFQEELALARKIQQGLLPKDMPDIKGVSIAAISSPAEMVGGDYYDLIQISDKQFFAVVADVSGKGISAALYMSKIQGMIQLASRMYKSPKDILIEVNRRIYDGIERKSFITMVLALFDFETNKVTISRAGHNKPLIVSKEKAYLLDSTGMGLGLESGSTFDDNLNETVLDLNDSKLFIFYSDGLTEMMNKDFQEFGEENLFNFVNKYSELSPDEMKSKLMEDINVFRGEAEQHDDLTFIIVKTENNH